MIDKKINRPKNNSEKLSRTKVAKHIPSGFLVSLKSSFENIENKHEIYGGKDSMKKF